MTESTATTSNVTNVESPKQSFIQRRIVTPIKNHPKIAIAVLAGVTLVGAAALTGKTGLALEDLDDTDLEPHAETVSPTPES